MPRKRSPRARGRFGRVTDVRFAQVELRAPLGTRMVIEVEGGLRLLVADEGSVALAAQLLNGLRGAAPRTRKGGRR